MKFISSNFFKAKAKPSPLFLRRCQHWYLFKVYNGEEIRGTLSSRAQYLSFLSIAKKDECSAA